MLRRLVITAALAALLAGALLGTSPAASPSEYDPNTLIVNFSDSGRAHPLIQALGDLLGGQLRDGSAVVQLRGGRSVEQALALYRVLPGVRFAEPNFLAHADIAAPNDPSFGSQWALSSTKINAVAGWSIYPNSYASSGGPTIAILDTGVQANHPDLNGKVLTGANCLSGSCGSGNSADDNGHGTHVGGTAAALTNNSTGIAGVAPNARILPVKVLDSNGSGSYAAIAAGINWAVGQGARVINMSLSGSSFSSALCNAVSNAVAAGVVVVAAAGNSGSSAARYPAACSGTIGVAATTSSDVYASFSSYGSPNVFVSAPGDSVYATVNGSTYATYSGTSMSSPHVAGLAALLLGQSPGRSVVDVKTILARTSDKVGSVSYGSDPYGTCSGCTWSQRYGYGRIDMGSALAYSGSPSPPPPPPPPPPPSQGTVTQYPASASVTSGALVGGTAAGLGADDGNYYEVRSSSFLWFVVSPAFSASFTGVPSTASNLQASHIGQGSTTCTLTLSIYNFSTRGWTTLGQQSIGSSGDSTFTPPARAGAAGAYRSSSGEVRVRAGCAGAGTSSYSLRSDQLKLTYSG